MQKKTGLEVEGLHFSIHKKCVLKKFALALPQGEACLILGPSGSGKTTLLSILAGLQRPDQGTVRYGDTNVYDLSEGERDRFRGRHIGILFQTFHLIKPLTVWQNLMLAYSMPGKTPDIARMEAMLERLRLKDKSGKSARHLSVGEAQRLALARAVISKPAWLLCDEPTSSLDDYNADEMTDILQEEAQEAGTSLIIVTHDHRVRRQLKGRIIELGGNTCI